MKRKGYVIAKQPRSGETPTEEEWATRKKKGKSSYVNVMREDGVCEDVLVQSFSNYYKQIFNGNKDVSVQGLQTVPTLFSKNNKRKNPDQDPESSERANKKVPETDYWPFVTPQAVIRSAFCDEGSPDWGVTPFNIP